MNYINQYCSSVNYASIKTGFNSLSAEVINNPIASLTAVGRVALGIFKCYTLYNLYEAALSDILCLKTFRHGTDSGAWLKIHLFGPDYKRGGLATGGEARYFKLGFQTDSPFAHRDTGRFYLVQDFFERNKKAETIFSYIFNKSSVKYYALRSTMSYYATWLPVPASWKASFIREGVQDLESDSRVRIFGLACPSVKFHLDPKYITYPQQSNTPLHSEVTHKFIKDGSDSDYCEPFSGACYTEDQLSVTDIGICGILKNGLNRNLPQRIWSNKGQFLWGVTQLVASVALTAFFFPTAAAAIPHGNMVASVIQNIFDKGRSNKISNIGHGIIFGFSSLFIVTQF